MCARAYAYVRDTFVSHWLLDDDIIAPPLPHEGLRITAKLCLCEGQHILSNNILIAQNCCGRKTFEPTKIPTTLFFLSRHLGRLERIYQRYNRYAIHYSFRFGSDEFHVQQSKWHCFLNNWHGTCLTFDSVPVYNESNSRNSNSGGRQQCYLNHVNTFQNEPFECLLLNHSKPCIK